jgi:hypothetical protein
MTVVIDAAQGGGYKIHLDIEGLIKPFVEVYSNSIEAMDVAQQLVDAIEKTMGEKVDAVISREAVRRNKDRDITAWIAWNSPEYHALLARKRTQRN